MPVELASLLEHYGLLIVFIAVLIDQLGIPLPAIPVLVAAGTLAAAGKANAVALFSGSVLACLIADSVWFLIGKRYGMRVLKTLCRVSIEPDSCVSETQHRFERWGANSLVVAKFVPGLSVIAPPLAGALEVGWPRFLALSTLGSALWVGVGLGAGAAFKTQLEWLSHYLARYAGTAVAVLVVLFAAYIAYKWRQRRRFLAELSMARITVDELYTLVESGGQPVILDVRTHTARGLEPRWIPSAIHAPVAEIEQRLRELPRDREVIVYCTCPNEASAALVAKQLMRHGFKRVRPLHGGLDAWIAAGHAVEPSLGAAPAEAEGDVAAGVRPAA
jgi:membrane protein DedA with SNARE-associated domain/rhodanese-related sulfurtransferase